MTAAKVVKTTLDTLDVQEMDIKEVLKRIAFQSGLEIILDEDISARVTIYLKDVDVFDALRIILDTNNLAYSQDPPPRRDRRQAGRGRACDDGPEFRGPLRLSVQPEDPNEDHPAFPRAA